MFKYSTHTHYFAEKVGDFEAIRLIKESGFDYFDYSMFSMVSYNWQEGKATPQGPLVEKDYKKYVNKLKKYMKSIGAACNQAHAPFPVDNKEIRSWLKRAIWVASRLGAKNIVVHPDNNKTAEENAIMFKELVRYAKWHHINIVVENMWNWNNDAKKVNEAACSTAEDFAKHINVVNDKHFGACLDIGHACMMHDKNRCADIIKALGKKLYAIHLHDNDCIHDCHALPFTMNIDYVPIAKAMKEIGYKGDITLETDSFWRDLDPKDYPEKLKVALEAAKRFGAMIEND